MLYGPPNRIRQFSEKLSRRIWSWLSEKCKISMVYLHLLTSSPHWISSTLPTGQTCDLSSISTGHSFPRGSDPRIFNITSCLPQWVRPGFHVHSPTATVSAEHKTVYSPNQGLPSPRGAALITHWAARGKPHPCSEPPLPCRK